MTGTIFNVQRYSTHDGPGVRTTVFFKGCPLKCFWCQNPESQSMRSDLMQDQSVCVGCGQCAQICAASAVVITAGKSTIDRTACTLCGKCADVCPVQALKLTGYEISVDALMQIILKDRMQYINSGGGVTLSGGEATVQTAFALELLRACKAERIHTVLETCGAAKWDVFERLLPYVDLFLYDIKAVDPQKHLIGTGQRNEIILRNAERLVKLGKRVIVRMPLIPGYNANKKDITDFARFARDRLGLTAADTELLKYNPLGEEKYVQLGRGNPKKLQSQTDEEFSAFCKTVASVMEERNCTGR